MSRRAELTPEIISTIEHSTRQAHWPKIVARKLGVHGAMFDGWMKRGEKAHLEDQGQQPEDPEFLYRQLYERVEEAEADAEIILLNNALKMAEQGKTSWNGFLTTMERRFSDRWRKRDALAGDLQESYEAQVKKAFMNAQTSTTAPTQLRAID